MFCSPSCDRFLTVCLIVLLCADPQGILLLSQILAYMSGIAAGCKALMGVTEKVCCSFLCGFAAVVVFLLLLLLRLRSNCVCYCISSCGSLTSAKCSKLIPKSARRAAAKPSTRRISSCKSDAVHSLKRSLPALPLTALTPISNSTLSRRRSTLVLSPLRTV